MGDTMTAAANRWDRETHRVHCLLYAWDVRKAHAEALEMIHREVRREGWISKLARKVGR